MSEDTRCDVLHVVWPGDYNGVVLQAAGLVRAAAREGALVQRICFLAGEGAVAESLESEGLASRLHFKRGWAPLGLWRFARALRAARPQVVHFHWRAFGAIGVAAAVLPRTPFVWTEHHEGPLIASAPARLFYRLVRRRFSRFVVTSEAMGKLVERYGVAAGDIDVIPYAILIPERLPASPQAGRGAVIGVVTRLDDRKRVDLFVDVVAELRARGRPYSGLVVGDGPYRARYEAYARERGMGDAIEFVGMQADVAGWLDRFDVFLTTSSVDTFGIATLEAMARGVAVVGMPCPGGLAELLERGGVLVGDREARTAADAVDRLLSSADERFDVASRGHELAAGHTLPAMLAQHLAVYSRLGASSVREKPLPAAR